MFLLVSFIKLYHYLFFYSTIFRPNLCKTPSGTETIKLQKTDTICFCPYISFKVFLSLNVPAVCDVPAHPIKQTAGLRVGWNVPEWGVGASVATDLAECRLAALWRRYAYSPVEVAEKV